MRQFLTAFVVGLATFYVALLAVQAISNGQLTRGHYISLASITVGAMLFSWVIVRIRCRTPVKKPLPKAGSVGRLLCEACGKPVRSSRWRCPSCGAMQHLWTVAPGMMSGRARRRAQAIVSADGKEITADGDDLDRRALQDRAAQFLIAQSGRPFVEEGDPVEQLLAHPGLTKSLYWAAAQRLHPDHNAGRHLPEWFELQQALACLSESPDDVTTSASRPTSAEAVRP